MWWYLKRRKQNLRDRRRMVYGGKAKIERKAKRIGLQVHRSDFRKTTIWLSLQ